MKSTRALLACVALAACVVTFSTVRTLWRSVLAQQRGLLPFEQLASGGEAVSRSSRELARAEYAGEGEGARSTSGKPGACKLMPHTDYWGEALVWGSTNIVKTAEGCCQQCQDYKPARPEDPTCNVWVWCGDKALCGAMLHNCWIKYLAHPEAHAPKVGPEIPWTSGLVGDFQPPPEDPPPTGGAERAYHTVITAQGTAVHWQARVYYYWFRKQQRACRAAHGAACQMGGFTRILHSGKADELVGEVPTMVVEPLPDKDNLGYVVLNRPYAFVQWLQRANISERYVLMSEPDHLWLRPMPNLMTGERPAAFPFFYIEPGKPENKVLAEKFTGPLTRAQAESIAPMGNAPTFIALRDLRALAPKWVEVSKAIFDDPPAHAAWGWVLEMYGFTLTAHILGLPPASLHVKMMAQPPWDTALWPYYLLHLTYGMDYTLQGEFTPGKIGAWRFDKRSYAQLPPPRNLEPPPKQIKSELVPVVIAMLNEASAAIPGWDEYARTGKATQFWDGTLPKE